MVDHGTSATVGGQRGRAELWSPRSDTRGEQTPASRVMLFGTLTAKRVSAANCGPAPGSHATIGGNERLRRPADARSDRYVLGVRQSIRRSSPSLITNVWNKTALRCPKNTAKSRNASKLCAFRKTV